MKQLFRGITLVGDNVADIQGIFIGITSDPWSVMRTVPPSSINVNIKVPDSWFAVDTVFDVKRKKAGKANSSCRDRWHDNVGTGDGPQACALMRAPDGL